MTTHEPSITKIRLASQQLSASRFTTVKRVVEWMGALQAQDYAMSKWAIGIRLPGSSIDKVEKAIDKGEIIRTHVLRPTWHFVSSNDVGWMLMLTAPQIKTKQKTHLKTLGLSANVLSKSYRILEKTLHNNNHLGRDELSLFFKKAGIAVNENRMSHLLLAAELEGLICSGSPEKGKHTYALLEERIPKTKNYTKEEALAKLAQKYFDSHGPATLADFTWWSGLPAGSAKSALASMQSAMQTMTAGSQSYFYSASVSEHAHESNAAYLLPAYDEYLISYKDRSAALTAEHSRKTLSSNGIFWPAIVVNGKVEGVWKRTMENKTSVRLEFNFFEKATVNADRAIKKAAAHYGKFLRAKVSFSR